MLKLVKLSKKYQKHLFEMMDEWSDKGEKIVPFSIRRLDYHNFSEYLNGINQEEAGIEGLVPASTFFCLDDEKDIFIGAVNIRHFLNESLLFNGGHIGDGIRPSQRNKGYGTKIVSLALKECRKLNLLRVLMVCDKENTASAKTISGNGGILENEVECDGKIFQRYWIEL